MASLLVVASTLLAHAVTAALPPLGIGCNIEGLSYWDGDLKTCDILKEGSEFGAPGGPWQGTAALDADGWPTEDFSVILVDNMHNHFTELWHVTGVAAAAPTIVGVASSLTVVNSTFDPASGAFSAFVQLTNQTMVTLGFTGTGGGVRNLSVWRTACPAGATFHPFFTRHLERCSILRFLDFAAINDNNISHWADRIPVSWPQWTGGLRAFHGAPWEAAVALVNAGSQDLWVQIPTLADDDYVVQLATLLKAQLHAGANIYTEFSNEVWNYGFDQFHWMVALANASVVQSGDPLRLDFDRCGNVWYWASRMVAHNAAIRIPALFKTVFGNASVGFNQRVRPVLAGQVSYTEPILVGLDYLEAVWGPPASFLHAFAGAPYFGAGTANISTVDELLVRVEADVAGVQPAAGWGAGGGLQQHATLAAWHRVFLRGYEGGQDFSGGGNNYTLSGATQRDPRFAGVVQRYFEAWSAYGTNECLNQYTAGASDWSEQYGCWGLVEDIADTASTKLVGFDAARAAPRPANALGIPVPTADFPAGFFSGCNAPNASAAGTLGLHGGSAVLYPVNLSGLAAGATLRVFLNASASVIEVGLNGGRFQNVSTPGAAAFALEEGDVGGLFGGAAAIRLRGAVEGSYTVIATLSLAAA